MKRCSRKAICLLLGILFVGHFSRAGGEAAKLTHADAAVILAKHSGLFSRHIDADADMGKCVQFLNKHGIYFGLLEVLNGAEFTLKDCAQAMGQVDLVLSGEAEYHSGKVVLPAGIASWVEYCILNDVKYVQAYESMRQLLVIMRQKSG
jgi:hypothetical protein